MRARSLTFYYYYYFAVHSLCSCGSRVRLFVCDFAIHSLYACGLGLGLGLLVLFFMKSLGSYSGA